MNYAGEIGADDLKSDPDGIVYAKNCLIGGKAANEILRELMADHAPEVLIWKIAKQVKRGRWCGFEVGFASALARRLLIAAPPSIAGHNPEYLDLYVRGVHAQPDVAVGLVGGEQCRRDELTEHQRIRSRLDGGHEK